MESGSASLSARCADREMLDQPPPVHTQFLHALYATCWNIKKMFELQCVCRKYRSNERMIGKKLLLDCNNHAELPCPGSLSLNVHGQIRRRQAHLIVAGLDADGGFDVGHPIECALWEFGGQHRCSLVDCEGFVHRLRVSDAVGSKRREKDLGRNQVVVSRRIGVDMSKRAL